MRMSTYGLVLLAVAGLWLPVGLRAQSDNLRVSVANLSQDVELMGRQVKALRLEMEALRRENARLEAKVAAARADRTTADRLSDLAETVETLRQDYKRADAAQKKQIIEEVSKQIDALTEETQSAIETLAEAMDAAPSVNRPVRFSDDYPKTGLTYTVRSGDTLTKIAREHGSTVKHIQNANKIPNPSRDLRVGQTIFVPVAE